MQPFEIKAGEKTWRVGAFTRKARDVLTAAVTQGAWEAVEELKSILPAAYPEAKAEFLRLVGADEYKPGGKGWLAATGGPNGNSLFLLAMLKDHQPDATLADARELTALAPDSVEAALTVLVPDFFDFLADLPDTPGEFRRKFREAASKARAEAKTPSPSPTTTPSA